VDPYAGAVEKKSMKKKTPIKTLLSYAFFGLVVAFAVTILIFWIYQEIAPAIPMALAIGALVGMAIKLFMDVINREQKDK